MKRKRLLGSFAAVGLSTVLIVSSGAFGAVVANAQGGLGRPAVQQTNRAAKTSIEYQGSTVDLSAHALYVDAALSAEELGSFAFNTLQDAVAAAQAGTKEQPTVIYLAPDVYWTDDYANPADRPKDDLIGLKIPQSYITLAGMTGNPDDVVIASDRGQNAGANGNFNTIGVAHGFHAKDITIGNYCNVDLNYERDPSKSHTKRQEAITQAQAVTKVPGITDMDEWFFENCNIISRLNLFSRDERPNRMLLKDCHLECTDDSLGSGYITLFVNCDFDLYSNTPCGGASFYMQAFLGCDFTTHLSDNKTITLCKNTKPFAFIDCNFKGDMKGMEWKPSNLADDLRQIVSNNTLNGQPLTISPARPELSVTPDAQQMQAFKVNGEYNVYNLLNNAGYDEWDPLGQKNTMPVSTWNIQFDYPGITKDVIPTLEGNKTDSLLVTPVVLGGANQSVQWSVSDDALVLAPQGDGTVLVKGHNQTLETKRSCLTATAANGMQKVLYFDITPEIVAAPTVDGQPVISDPVDGSVSLSYTLKGATAGAKDLSRINWYRASQADGSDKVFIAQTTYVRDESAPYLSYQLRPADIGKYLICEVLPQTGNSEQGTAVYSNVSSQIAETDVLKTAWTGYEVDLEHLAYIDAEIGTKEENYEWKNTLESGNWYGGFYLPSEYREGGIWSDKAYQPAAGEAPYTYAAGASGAGGTYGLQTTTQGARLVYVDTAARKNMKMTIELSPHKTGAQGFGSAKQFMDIYFKYDAATMTGYGLRIARVPDIDDPVLSDYAAKSCTFTLMEYRNGVAKPLTDGVVSTAFLPGCTVVLEMKDNVFTADITTVSPQDSSSPAELVHEVHLTHTFDEANEFSGFGFQHTGTAGAGKSGNRTTIHSVNVEYLDPIVEPDVPVVDVPGDGTGVQTGDLPVGAIALYAGVMLLSLLLLAGGARRKKKFIR